MALTTELVSKLTASLTGAAAGLANPAAAAAAEDHFLLTTGVGAGQADKIYSLTNTLAASGTVNLDLAGSVNDPLGAALTIVKLKLIRVTAAAGNTNNVNLTAPASNAVPLFLGTTGGIPILPGGIFEWAAPGAGVTVTAATGDLLTFTNSGAGTGVTYTVTVVGTSA